MDRHVPYCPAVAAATLARMVEEKYAIGEYERRFLLAHRPHGMVDPRAIVDEYMAHRAKRPRSMQASELGDLVARQHAVRCCGDRHVVKLDHAAQGGEERNVGSV